MAITFGCGCGKTLRVADPLAGRRVRCPACKAEHAVPAAEEAGFEVVGDDAPPPRAVAKPVVARRAPPPPPADDAGFEVVENEEEPKAYKMKPDDARRPGDDAPVRPRQRQKDRYDDEDDGDRAARRRATADPRRMRRGKPAANPLSTRNMTIGFGALLLLAGVVVAVVYWNSDAEVTGRRGRKTSASTFGIILAVSGGLTAGRGATMSEDDEDGSDDDD